MEDNEGYSPFFYMALLVMFIWIIGFTCTSAVFVGG